MDHSTTQKVKVSVIPILIIAAGLIGFAVVGSMIARIIDEDQTGGVSQFFTVRVNNTAYQFITTNPQMIADATAAYQDPARHVLHPNGRLIAGGAPDNPLWTWHYDANDVSMSQLSMELCDGSVQDVEQAGIVFDNGRFCPWDGRIIWVGVDAVSPTVSITAPTANARVSGIVSVTFTETDNVFVARTEIFIDSAKVATVYDHSYPVIYRWDSTTVANGSHIITVKALDAAGNSRTQAVPVTVANG